MAQAMILILVSFTSTGAFLIGTRGLRLRGRDLGAAIGKMLECIGVILVFFVANLTIGLVAILVGRSLTGAFVSTYSMSDVVLLVVSFLQGLIFHCWHQESRESRVESRET
jgi:hypothetical protein